ncbi:MAG: cohesin domain-containing protein [Chloroflexota bacterium]|nr:cohesin domain-containing protein [Chloroflexota bacterium]
MRVWVDLGLLALADHWKVAMGGVTILVVVVVGTLLFGVLGSDTAAADLTPTTSVQPTAVPDAVSTPVPTQVPTSVAKAAPTPLPKADPTSSRKLIDPIVLLTNVNVPIHLTGAENIGSLEFVLTYDPSVLEVSGVEAGDLAQSSLFDFGTRSPGRLWAGLIDSEGINGDGPIAVVSFKVVGPGASTSLLTLENITTYDASSLLDILTNATSGSFTVDGRALTAPTLAFPR